MKEIDDFTELITSLSCNKAKEFAGQIYRNNSKKYAESLLTVVLVNTNRKLQKLYKNYYVAEEIILDNDANAVIDKMCSALRDIARDNRQKTVDKAISYINENFFVSDLYACSVAEFVGVSGAVLSKYFEESKGITPVRYITQLRVEKSKELLIKGDSVNDIAIKCGFSSVESYIRAFKKICGLTPGKYREIKRGEKSEV